MKREEKELNFFVIFASAQLAAADEKVRKQVCKSFVSLHFVTPILHFGTKMKSMHNPPRPRINQFIVIDVSSLK